MPAPPGTVRIHVDISADCYKDLVKLIPWGLRGKVESKLICKGVEAIKKNEDFVGLIYANRIDFDILEVGGKDDL